MGRARKWNDKDLTSAVKSSFSVRTVIKKLGLVPAGGNYIQVKVRIKDLNLDTSHFTGKGWKKGNSTPTVPKRPLSELLTRNSKVQSYKLKNRLLASGVKQAKCELCSWSRKSVDGRIPIELDHINGDRYDNRIENLRILCPNCHSLQSTHRGLNQQRAKSP